MNSFSEAVRAALIVELWRHDYSNAGRVRRAVETVFGNLSPLHEARRLGLVKLRCWRGKVVGFDTTRPGSYVVFKLFPQYIKTLPRRRGNWKKLLALGNDNYDNTESDKENGVAYVFVPGAETFGKFIQRVIISEVKRYGTQKQAAFALRLSPRVVNYWCRKFIQETGV